METRDELKEAILMTTTVCGIKGIPLYFEKGRGLWK
jgi:hypothetical protein